MHGTGVEERVELRVGPAEESLQALLERDGPGSYDMAFIGACGAWCQGSVWYDKLMLMAVGW